MKYFTEEEFLGWYDEMDHRLLQMLDALRELLGCPLYLSKLEGAIGRHAGSSGTWHNIDKHGKVYAVDGGIPESVTYNQLYDACLAVGFTGIGLYSGWNSGRGFHVDTRTDRDSSNPAVWSGIYVKGKTSYGSIQKLLN